MIRARLMKHEFWVVFVQIRQHERVFIYCVIKGCGAETVTNLLPFTNTASNHCSMEQLSHPSIMLSRHMINVCVCVREGESVCLRPFHCHFEALL